MPVEGDDALRRVGTTLRDKWRLTRLIGAGGMAAVYEAHHRIGRVDAIKILHPSVAAVPMLRQRFEQEAHAANRLHHSGAVEVRDVDLTEDGAPFMVMELVDGETLVERFRREGPPDPRQLLRWMDEALDVLVAAHDLGIVHRDIKPDNLLVTTSGSLKVLDFGVARMSIEPAAGVRTRSGVAIGTVSYMAPEQIRGEVVDGRADLFSLGATGYRLLTGKRLHESEGQADLMHKMANVQARPVAELLPGLPRGIARIVDRALSLHRDARYPDARTMQRDVRAVLEGNDPPWASAPPTDRAAFPGRSSVPSPAVASSGRLGPPTASLVDAPGPALPRELPAAEAPTVVGARPPPAQLVVGPPPAQLVVGPPPAQLIVGPPPAQLVGGPTLASPVHAPPFLAEEAPPETVASPESFVDVPEPLPRWWWALVVASVAVGACAVFGAILLAIATSRVIDQGHPGHVFYGASALVAMVGGTFVALGLRLARRIG